ncbi:MAG: hypothetical protein IPL23_10950 [Saprospiraceae bacterium]|nr:hypothetical protein [Saprospiraceae bacterium]
MRYAYYASDNPLETGSTLASGSLGLDEVRNQLISLRQVCSTVFLRNNKLSVIEFLYQVYFDFEWKQQIYLYLVLS